ncbi:MAG: VanZ family protein [Steroidobacteraceae bacterium]|nr:VanZ family protein [Steroidobacteraceae bacterium]
MTDANRRIAAWLLAVIAFLIVYGSLYPFRFGGGGGRGWLELAGTLSFARTTRSDIAANVLLYLPLGACLAWLLAIRLGGLLAVLAATVAAAALSFAIEFAQLYETRRVASLGDVLYNTVGAFAGAWIALAIAATHRRLRASPFAGLLRYPVATALLLSWAGYRLAPFAPVLDPGKWAGAFAPLAEGGWWTAGQIAPHALAWLVIAQCCARIAPLRPAALLAGAMAAVLAGRVLFAGLALEPAEVAGMAAALALAHPLARLPGQRAAALLAAALVALVAIQGLVPFDFQLAPDRFALLPFAESLMQYRAASLTDMFLRCFTTGALVWLLVRSGLPVLPATATGAGTVFAIELLQTWLPAHTAEITDPLLAIAAGGLIAVFEREDGGR